MERYEYYEIIANGEAFIVQVHSYDHILIDSITWVARNHRSNTTDMYNKVYSIIDDIRDLMNAGSASVTEALEAYCDTYKYIGGADNAIKASKIIRGLWETH
jgi:hypothetical protein